MKLAAKHLKTPVRIEVAPSGTTADQIDQEIYLIKTEDKLHHLESILAQYKGSVLIFTRTKYGAKGLVRKLKDFGFSAAEIHSNLSLNQRKDALGGFKSGKYRILVGTDIAARGLDVNDIELVVNYNLPDNLDDYVHRIGRTARAGKSGKAISFAGTNERRQIKEIEKLINKSLPLKELTGMKFPERKPTAGENKEIGRSDFSRPRNFEGRERLARDFGERGARAPRTFGENRSRPAFDRDRKPFKREDKPFKREEKPFKREEKPFGRPAKPFSQERSSQGTNKLFSERSFSVNGRRFGAEKAPVNNYRAARSASSTSLFGFERDLLPERNIKASLTRPAARSGERKSEADKKPARPFKRNSSAKRFK